MNIFLQIFLIRSIKLVLRNRKSFKIGKVLNCFWTILQIFCIFPTRKPRRSEKPNRGQSLSYLVVDFFCSDFLCFIDLGKGHVLIFSKDRADAILKMLAEKLQVFLLLMFTYPQMNNRKAGGGSQTSCTELVLLVQNYQHSHLWTVHLPSLAWSQVSGITTVTPASRTGAPPRSRLGCNLYIVQSQN